MTQLSIINELYIEDHPSTFNTRFPRILTESTDDLTPTEFILYSSIFDRKNKTIPDSVLIPISVLNISIKNSFKILGEIKKKIGDKSIKIPEKVNQVFYGKDSNLSVINPISKIDLYITKEKYLKIEQSEPVVIIELNKDFIDYLNKIKAYNENNDLVYEGLKKGFLSTQTSLIRSKITTSERAAMWFIRKKQPYKYTTKILIDDFKIILGVEGQYVNNWRDFKKKKLDFIKEKFNNTWFEFSYEAKNESGSGRSFDTLYITFKNGPNEEKNIPYGFKYPYEEKMKELQFEEKYGFMLRNRIQKIQKIIVSGVEDKKVIDYGEIEYNERYVQFALYKAIDKVNEKIAKKEKIENVHRYCIALAFEHDVFAKEWFDLLPELNKLNENKQYPIEIK